MVFNMYYGPNRNFTNNTCKTISEYTKNLKIEIGILTGSSTMKQRTELHKKLKSGEISILIGTHFVRR